MFNLNTFATIHDRVTKYREDYSLEDLGTAFTWLALESILSLNEDEIEDVVTDGPMDGGIDAIYISNREVHVFNFKYAETFENSKHNFPEEEINKILVTMQGIYGESIKENDVNDMLWDKINEIWALFKDGPPPVFKYYLCSNKEKPVDHARRKLESTLDRYRFVEYHYYDQEDIVSKILEKKFRRVDGIVNFVDTQYFDRSDGPLKGIVATIAANDLIELIKDPNKPEMVNEDVFNENVRIYMKLKNRINQGIYETALSNENFEFWYLNNGITIVCDECVYTPNTRSPAVRLSNLQIVNGGQTTHALFEAYLKDSQKLNNVLVLVRICETKSYNISERISETTNSQTPVRTRDLHSNDRIQRKLEEQFLTLQYYYERKKNQHQGKPKDRRLDNELLGQIYLAYYLSMPSEAKNQKVVVFADKYDEIFDENIITAKKMLIPYKFYLPLEAKKKEIQKKKRKKEPIDEKDAFISRSIFHLLNVINIIVDKEPFDLEKQDTIELAIDKAITFVGEVVKEEADKRGSLYTHDKFFKEVPTNEIIRKHVLSKYS